MTDKQLKILVKAKGVFLSKGLFNIVMDDIAEASGLTRRTLYRHFETKEDIAYETTTMILHEMNVTNERICSELLGNGLEKLEAFLHSQISLMKNQPEVMKYIGEFDFYFKDDALNSPMSNHEAYDEKSAQSDTIITSLIKEGVEDGSIKKNIDVPLTEATMANVLWGFGQRIAIRSKIIEKETGYEGIQLIKNQVALYMDALRND